MTPTAYIVCTLGIKLLSGTCRDDAEYGGTVEVQGVFIDDEAAAQAFCDGFNLENKRESAIVVTGDVLNNDIRILSDKANPRDRYKESKPIHE